MHIINQIFNRLESQKIKYCHFKSNQHLSESFQGTTDFDILIDYQEKSSCEIILNELNCKRFETRFIGQYPGVENWLAFDETTGSIFHIHLHYQLITGKRFVKDFFLPWEDLFLDSAIQNSDYKIMTSNPNLEMILLLTRIVLKRNFSDDLKAMIGIYSLRDNLEREYLYLLELVELEKLEEYLSILFSPVSVKMISKIVAENKSLSSKQFYTLVKVITKELKDYRRISKLTASFKSRFFKSVYTFNIIKRKLFGFNISRKVNNSGGRIIAFVGVDGSGKSTITTEVNTWLSKAKIENKKVYMGAGDGSKNLISKFLQQVRNVVKNKIGKKEPVKNTLNMRKTKNKVTFWKNPLKYLNNYLLAIELYYIAKNNRKKIVRMNNYRRNGGFAILDRYPQLQQPGINDGLKLGIIAEKLSNNFVFKLSKKEESLLKIVEDICPDMVFRLNISAKTSMSRKPEHKNFDYFKSKAESIKTIKFDGSVVNEIDAERDINTIILEIKKIIWESI